MDRGLAHRRRRCRGRSRMVQGMGAVSGGKRGRRYRSSDRWLAHPQGSVREHRRAPHDDGIVDDDRHRRGGGHRRILHGAGHHLVRACCRSAGGTDSGPGSQGDPRPARNPAARSVRAPRWFDPVGRGGKTVSRRCHPGRAWRPDTRRRGRALRSFLRRRIPHHRRIHAGREDGRRSGLCRLHQSVRRAGGYRRADRP